MVQISLKGKFANTTLPASVLETMCIQNANGLLLGTQNVSSTFKTVSLMGQHTSAKPFSPLCNSVIPCIMLCYNVCTSINYVGQGWISNVFLMHILKALLLTCYKNGAFISISQNIVSQYSELIHSWRDILNMITRITDQRRCQTARLSVVVKDLIFNHGRS